jgi:hypothetical protein
MSNLENSKKKLISGVVSLLRDEINEWSQNDEYSVANVWPSNPPTSADNEFPRATVDIISGSDFDLSDDGEVHLREVTLKVVVFSDVQIEPEDLTEAVEDTISDESEADTLDQYIGDWVFREFDGTTPLVEDEGEEGMLRYNRSIDMIFETIK